MPIFRVVHIPSSQDKRGEGWAVQRCDPDGQTPLVTRCYGTEQEAANEAARLTREAARGMI